MTDHQDARFLDRISNSLSRVSSAQALIICAVLYAAVTGLGLLFEGYNFDDWRHLHGTPDLWAGPEGRWAMDFIFRFMLQEKFHLPLQILLAFFCLYGCSYLIARYSVGDRFHAVATVLIFLIGTNHIYMSSALMFNAHIFAYPLAFVLSLLAFHLVYQSRGASLLSRIVVVLVAAQMLAISLGIYQTFALFGLIIPVLVIALYDRYEIGREIQFLVLCGLVCVLGLGLYLVESELYRQALNMSSEIVRFETPNASDLVQKLIGLPAFLARIYAGGLIPAPTYFRLATALSALIGLGAIALTLLFAMTDRTEHAPAARLFNATRIAAAAAALLIVLPVLFWFTYKEAYAPGRTVAFVQFWLPAFSLGLLGLVLRQASNTFTRAIFVASVFGLSAVSAVSLLNASAVWTERARIHDTDRDFARAVYARVKAMEGFVDGQFRVVGGVDYSHFTLGGQLGWTTLHAGNPKLGIFKGMFNLPDYITSHPISPQSCEAMPSANAGFVHDGVAYVCLEAKTGFLPLTRCVDIDRDGIGTICLKDEMIIHVTPTCVDENGALRQVYVAHSDAAGETLASSRIEEQAFGLDLSDGCYYAIPDLDRPYAWLSIGLYESGTGVIWEERYSLEDFN